MAVEALGSPQTLVVCGLVATKGRAEEEILPHLGLRAVSREVWSLSVVLKATRCSEKWGEGVSEVRGFWKILPTH